MTETLDTQIREKIGEIITAALAEYDEELEAKVYTWNALTHQPSEWPALFRNDGLTHGWIIKLSRQTAERKNAQRDRVQLDYDIYGFYGFESGTADDNTDNTFSEIVAAVYNGIKGEPRLDFDAEVEYHELLQFERLTTINCGEETLHFAQGRLSVHLCC